MGLGSEWTPAHVVADEAVGAIVAPPGYGAARGHSCASGERDKRHDGRLRVTAMCQVAKGKLCSTSWRVSTPYDAVVDGMLPLGCSCGYVLAHNAVRCTVVINHCDSSRYESGRAVVATAHISIVLQWEPKRQIAARPWPQ